AVEHRIHENEHYVSADLYFRRRRRVAERHHGLLNGVFEKQTARLIRENIMRTKDPAEEGNVLICALCTILIMSLIGANVLQNCTTRFNVSSSQVRSWKESLFAAEAGGDIAYAEVRKTVLRSEERRVGKRCETR